MNLYTVEYEHNGNKIREIIFAKSEEVITDNLVLMGWPGQIKIESVVTFGDRKLNGVRVIGKVQSTVHRPDLQTVLIKL